MSEMTAPEKPVSRYAQYKTKALLVLGAAGIAAAPVAAVDLNASVGPILDGVIALIPTIIELIVAAVPAIIVIAVVGFVVKFLDQIVAMLNLK